MIRLQERDYQVLRLCYEQRFLTREHLATFFGHFTAYYRRLRALEGADLLKRELSPIVTSSFIVRPTVLGEQVVRDKYGVSFPPLKAPNLNVIVHDALVTSVRLRLEQRWDATYVPERAILAREFPEIPDGIFYFPFGRGIAIEVECSDKGKTRFLEKIKRWQGASSIAFVLYVCPHPGLYKSLVRYLSFAPEDIPAGVVLWEELRVGTPLVQTRVGKIDILSEIQNGQGIMSVRSKLCSIYSS